MGAEAVTIRVIREPSVQGATIGVVFLNDRHFGFSVEDEIREKAAPVASWKVPGETAIPAGRYPVVLSMSQRFGRVLPAVLSVPGFTGIRIHPGNGSGDTEGCLLFGMGRDGQRVTQSRMAVQAVQDVIAAAGAPCWIEIENPRSYAA